MRTLAAVSGLLAVLCAATPAQADLEYSGPSPATVRLGDASRLTLQVEGPDADPRIDELPEVDGLRMELSPPSRLSQQFFDGRRMVARNTVTYTVTIRPQREGEFTIPPIRVHTGTRWQQTPELRIDAVADMRGEEFGYLDVRIEPKRVYVHQPIRVRVEFGVDAGLRPVTDVHQRTRYVDCEVQAGWLSDMEDAVPLETPRPRDGTHIVLNRTLQWAEYSPRHERDGRKYHSFVFEKAYLPTKVGTIELAAPLLRYHVVLEEGSIGIFGERTGGRTEDYYVYGQPRELEVLPIPEEGRPTPYFGAVGDFEIDASLDRREVQVGSSVKLSFTITGEGNLEFLRVPALDDLPGLHKLGQTEKREPGRVEVVYDLAPLDAAIEEVPAIEWNWFDTEQERFVEASTEPLPLRVRPLEDGETLPPLPGTEDAVVPGVDDIHDLWPVEGEPVRAPERAAWRGWLGTLGPWLLVAAVLLGTISWRRRRADRLGRRARGAGRAFERALGSGEDPGRAFAGYLADRLGVERAAVIGPDLEKRLREAGIPEGLAARARAAVEAGLAARYGGEAGLSAEQARELVRELERQEIPFGNGRRPSGGAIVLVTLALLCGGTNAQQPQSGPRMAARALEAYRAGDHAPAAEMFREAAERTGDRRLFYNLGNARFRLGDYPRALWAWERARLAFPRDPELLANIELARRRLELTGSGGEPFLEALIGLRDSLTRNELLALGAGLHLIAALLLLGFWRRPGLRLVGFVLLVPALLVSLELVWWGPTRPPTGIVLERTGIVAEPRENLEPVLRVKPGVEVAVLGQGEEWTMVQLRGRRGYLPRGAVAVVR